MLVGRTSCGKTTLCQALREETLQYKKTQDIRFLPDVIDTPGEYVENVSYYRALMVTSAEAQVIVLIQACTESATLYPPGFAGMFGEKPIIGIVSKIDLCSVADCQKAEQNLRDAGVSQVFFVSAVTGEGLSALRNYLESK